MVRACHRVIVDHKMSHNMNFNDRWIENNNKSHLRGVVFQIRPPRHCISALLLILTQSVSYVKENT